LFNFSAYAGRMRNLLLNIGGIEHHWVQHNLPWLAMLAILFGLERDEAAAGDRSIGQDG